MIKDSRQRYATQVRKELSFLTDPTPHRTSPVRPDSAYCKRGVQCERGGPRESVPMFDRFGSQGTGCEWLVLALGQVSSQEAEGKTPRQADGQLRDRASSYPYHWRCRHRSCPSAGVKATRTEARRRFIAATFHRRKRINATTYPMPDSGHRRFLSSRSRCRSLVRDPCRTRGGSAVLGRNTDMRRHGVLRPETDETLPLRGSRRIATRGWCQVDFSQSEISHR
jgi:hypothetical protein